MGARRGAGERRVEGELLSHDQPGAARDGGPVARDSLRPKARIGVAGLDQNTLPAVLRAAVAVAPVAMLVADSGGRLLAANRRWIDLTGPADVTGRPEAWTAVFESSSRRRMEQHLADIAAGRPAPASVDAEVATPTGRRWTRWWARRETFDSTPVVVLVVVDVHDDVAQTEDLRRLATHDHLTGLLNRRFFVESVGQAQRRAERSGRRAALLYIDLDRFKHVNDAAGHHVGDQVLSVVGARLAQVIRGADVVARLGGDEFAVLLEDVHGSDQAGAVAARVQAVLAEPVEVSGDRWPVHASVGVAMAGPGEESPELWLKRADDAMYATKRARRVARQPVGVGVGTTTCRRQTGEESGSGRVATPIDVDETLAALRVLREELARVRRSLEDFTG